MSTKKAPAKKKPIGRPASRTDAQVAATKKLICDQLSEGVSLREICRGKGMPAWRTVYDWMAADEAFTAAIARARDIGYDAIAEQSYELVDQEPERGPDGKIDPSWVSHIKLRVDHRMKLLAKWSPKKYGDKTTTEHTGADGGPIQARIAVEFVKPPARGKGADE